jgi:hypothetical protein
MYDALISRLINRAYMICQINKDSQECKVAWDYVEDVMKSTKRKAPPPKKPAPVDKDHELSQREYDI